MPSFPFRSFFLLFLVICATGLCACRTTKPDTPAVVARQNFSGNTPVPSKATPPPGMPSLSEFIRMGGNPSPQQFPFTGNWGYSQDTPCIITNPLAGTQKEFSFIPLEYSLAEMRFFVEFTVGQPQGQQMTIAGIQRESQALLTIGDRVFDKLVLTAILVSPKDIDSIKPLLVGKNTAEIAAIASTEPRLQKRTQEFWFDITAPFTHNGKLLAQAFHNAQKKK